MILDDYSSLFSIINSQRISVRRTLTLSHGAIEPSLHHMIGPYAAEIPEMAFCMVGTSNWNPRSGHPCISKLVRSHRFMVQWIGSVKSKPETRRRGSDDQNGARRRRPKKRKTTKKNAPHSPRPKNQYSIPRLTPFWPLNGLKPPGSPSQAAGRLFEPSAARILQKKVPRTQQRI